MKEILEYYWTNGARTFSESTCVPCTMVKPLQDSAALAGCALLGNVCFGRNP